MRHHHKRRLFEEVCNHRFDILLIPMDLTEQEEDIDAKNEISEADCCQQSTSNFHQEGIQEDIKDVDDLAALVGNNVAVYNAAAFEQDLLQQA
ncbi:unnamed protein product [Onchocerca ochengi]|uniref:Rho-GAP domain-containing protein n=1 Tax=Onchocerca ochengi TaxID=42157 RepID=A0A182E3S3_ONCOC|nr:unnamed protein product [Onchocerca ochengi]